MLNDNENRTELGELGEFGLIEHLTKNIKLKNNSSVKGVGDDAAIIDSGNLQNVVTSDMLLEGVHFDLSYCPLKHLGYKAAVVNISDVLAMNAMPKQLVVNLGVSNRFSVEAVTELYKGIYLACENYGVDVIGGDTSSSMSGLVISITAIGEAKDDEIVYRTGAKENDLVCVSGDLGGAFMGLQILEREKAVFKENPKVQPDLDGNDYILERQLKPEARLDIIKMFREEKIKPTSMIDISDGLSSELIHLCNQSKVGCTIFHDKIPIDSLTVNAAMDFNLAASTCALNGGEDYELLFTLALDEYEKVKNNPYFSIIGHISDEASGTNFSTQNGELISLQAQGWNGLDKDKKEE